jgi:glyoxylase-like metal-dependent hydrolase (beta-lactamase superfamily II)
MKLHAIEGNTQRLDGGAMFGNAPKEMWKRWIKPDDKNRIPLACRSLHVETDAGQHILFDVGVGAFFEPKYRERYGVEETEHCLLANLEKQGLSHESIDAIILSHLHFDHAGGLLSAFEAGQESELLFPNATIYTGREHFERARTPRRRERASFIPRIQELLESSGRLVLLDSDSHPDLDGISFSYVNGHTVGSTMSWIDVGGETLIFAADLIPGLAWMHLPITMGYDRFPELVVEEKTETLNELYDVDGYVFFTHDPSVSCARVRKDVKGRFYGDPVDVGSLAQAAYGR